MTCSYTVQKSIHLLPSYTVHLHAAKLQCQSPAQLHCPKMCPSAAQLTVQKVDICCLATLSKKSVRLLLSYIVYQLSSYIAQQLHQLPSYTVHTVQHDFLLSAHLRCSSPAKFLLYVYQPSDSHGVTLVTPCAYPAACPIVQNPIQKPVIQDIVTATSCTVPSIKTDSRQITIAR